MSPRRAVACRALVAALAIGLLAVACAGSAERLSVPEYRKRASTHCETLEDASNELRKAQQPSATGKTVTQFLHRAADRLRDLVQGLDGLEPPAALETDADELVGLLDDYADGLDELADSVGPGDTLVATFEKNTQLVQRLNGVAGNATSLVTRLELTGCMLAT